MLKLSAFGGFSHTHLPAQAVLRRAVVARGHQKGRMTLEDSLVGKSQSRVILVTTPTYSTEMYFSRRMQMSPPKKGTGRGFLQCLPQITFDRSNNAKPRSSRVLLLEVMDLPFCYFAGMASPSKEKLPNGKVGDGPHRFG